MSEQYSDDEQHYTGPVSSQENKKSHQKSHRAWEAIGAAVIVGAVGAGALEYFVFYKPDTAEAQDIGNKKLTVGLELGQLGFNKDLLTSIGNFDINRKGMVNGKANTGDTQYPKCDVTYDMTFDPSSNSVTFKLPAVEDAAGNKFGEFQANTPEEVKTRTAELCAQQAANAASPSASPSK
jgi:hypothetical protein